MTHATRRGLALPATLAALAGATLLVLHPVTSRSTKLALVICGVATWIGVTSLAWPRRPLRILLLALPLLLAVPLVLPGAAIEAGEVRQAYVQRMRDFVGTPYRWGGESGRGIDCSGLPRRAWRDALLAYGLQHGNGRALRMYIAQWWFDASARSRPQARARTPQITMEERGLDDD
ncbi:MAG: C40 family peptidase [Acidobacteria bacterium]|nr:C40 family peptidase [Acidobacteriota bacterium]